MDKAFGEETGRNLPFAIEQRPAAMTGNICAERRILFRRERDQNVAHPHLPILGLEAKGARKIDFDISSLIIIRAKLFGIFLRQVC